MSGISINSNLAAQRALGRLSRSNYELGRSFERLGSGARINRASDDAAGLSISSLLRADTRVYNQGLRNFNDGLSALSIAEGGLRELSGVGIRIRELAEQAANGTYSLTQRRALNAEANSLVSEFNRIINVTEFNGQKLLNLNIRDLRLQGGYGINGSISVGIGSQLKRNVGSGNFGDPTSVDTSSGGTGPTGTVAADFNGDNHVDIAVVNAFNDGATIKFGDGNGGFSGTTNISITGDPSDLVAGDFNQDGRQDLAFLSVNPAADYISVHLNQGSGTFSSGTTYQLQGNATNQNNLVTADFNNDGRLDIAAGVTDGVRVFLGTGTGSFQSAITALTGGAVGRIAVGDVHGDGRADLVTTGPGPTNTILLSGNGLGGFSSTVLSQFINALAGIELTDLNNDGLDDIVATFGGVNGIHSALSRGEGSFSTINTIVLGDLHYKLAVGDYNGDGLQDAVVGSDSTRTLTILKGNGDGTFSITGTRTGGSDYFYSEIVFADLNEDGAADLVQSSNAGNSFNTFIAQATETTSISAVNLNTQASARHVLDSMNFILERIGRELGAIGAGQSRLSAGIANLSASSENYSAASSRITDVDVASESAQLIRHQILSQVSVAVLSQAKLMPELALTLLRA